MEEDIKILDTYLDKVDRTRVSFNRFRFLKAIENLIKGYKKLKEDFEIVDHECSRLEKEDIRKDLEIKELQKELDKYKEMYAVSIADRVNSAFKQEHKNNEDLEMLYKGCQIELEEKDKKISKLEYALMDMVLQFADENKDSINTMGLSALEIAFNELNFDNPMSIKEVHKRYKKLEQKYYQ